MESDISPRERLSILMVTGVYHPEVNGAANQCRQLVNALSKEISFTVLTTTRDPNLSMQVLIDGVNVSRVLLKDRNFLDYFMAIIRFTSFIFSLKNDLQIIHLHGFSLKSALIVFLSKIFKKKVIIKMTLIGHDDPVAIKKRGIFINYLFNRADAYISISPRFQKIYQRSNLPLNRLKQIPNGVDIQRFFPLKLPYRLKLRNHLGLMTDSKIILFVGHWSRSHKNPDMLFYVWKEYIANIFPESILLFVGSRNLDNFEVDFDLVTEINDQVKTYFNDRVFFIEKTHHIEKYYQASDVFILPSIIEGLPNALLESMACGLPVIASRLEGVTDWVVDDGINGLLVEPGIQDDLGRAIEKVLNDSILAERLGWQARRTIEHRFSIDKVADQYAELYRRLVPSA